MFTPLSGYQFPAHQTSNVNAGTALTSISTDDAGVATVNDLATSADFVLTFNENVQAGSTGSFTFTCVVPYDGSDTTATATVAVPVSDATFEENRVSLAAVEDLPDSAKCTLSFDQGVVRDLAWDVSELEDSGMDAATCGGTFDEACTLTRCNEVPVLDILDAEYQFTTRDETQPVGQKFPLQFFSRFRKNLLTLIN